MSDRETTAFDSAVALSASLAQHLPNIEQFGAMALSLVVTALLLAALLAKVALMLTGVAIFHLCVMAWAKAFVAGMKERRL